MLSMYSKAILAFLAAFWTVQPIASQKITNVMEENISYDHVVVVATIDPMSSTYTFSWVVSINGGIDIELAVVWLNGTGGVLVNNKSEDYIYNVKNDPQFLPNQNNRFTSRLTFNFADNAYENLVFKTVSSPLYISIHNPVEALMCQENIICEDNTTSCKRCGSNLPGFLSCSNGRKVRGYCRPEGNKNAAFVPEDCDPGCQENVNCEDNTTSCTRCGSNVSRISTCSNGGIIRGYCKCNRRPVFVYKDCDPVTLWTTQPIAAQNITNVTVKAQLCDQVVVVASVYPLSSTYTFNWVASINGSDDIDLALVGLNGSGGVLVTNRSQNYKYNVKNDPEFLPNGNNPFISRLTFDFTDNAYENLIFRVVSTPSDISIPHPVGAKMCQEDITCEDNTTSCKRCGSDVQGILRFSNGREVIGYCRGNETAAFDAEDSCAESELIGLVLISVSGICALIGLIGFFSRKCYEDIDLRRLLFAVIGGVGLILSGIGLIVWRTAEVLYLGLGNASIVLGISFMLYGTIKKKEKNYLLQI